MCAKYNNITNNDDVLSTDEGLVFNPYNSLNQEITLNEIQSILSKYGITFPIHNINLYKRAFVHRSYIKRPELINKESGITIVPKPKNCISLKTKSNERLEFIGDGVLELITKYYLYRRFPKEDEGFMTEKKIALVKNEHIGKLAFEMKLQNWLLISRNAEDKNIRNNQKKLGCLFEAFLGALFLDFNKISIKDEDKWFENIFVTGPGFQMCQLFVESIFEKHVDWHKLISTDDNYKNILQVKLQKTFKLTPDYLELSRDIDSGYEMGVYLCINQNIYNLSPSDAIPFQTFGSFENIQSLVDNMKPLFILLGKGQHKIKKKAEQIACNNALILLNKS